MVTGSGSDIWRVHPTMGTDASLAESGFAVGLGGQFAHFEVGVLKAVWQFGVIHGI